MDFSLLLGYNLRREIGKIRRAPVLPGSSASSFSLGRSFFMPSPSLLEMQRAVPGLPRSSSIIAMVARGEHRQMYLLPLGMGHDPTRYSPVIWGFSCLIFYLRRGREMNCQTVSFGDNRVTLCCNLPFNLLVNTTQITVLTRCNT